MSGIRTKTFAECNIPATDQIIAFLATLFNSVKDKIPFLQREATKASMVLPNQYDDEIMLFISDMKTLHQMKRKGVINWCPSIRYLTPLAVADDGNSMTHAVSMYIFGIQDREHHFRQLIYQMMFMLQNQEKGDMHVRWQADKAETIRLMLSSKNAYYQEERDKDWTYYLRNCSRQKDHNGKYLPLEGLHIFALANILARPIIVLINAQSTVDEEMIQGVRLEGVYLPFLRDPMDCEKSPVVIGYEDNRFVSMLSTERMDLTIWGSKTLDHAQHCIPLLKSDFSKIRVRFLKNYELSNRQKQLETYFDLVQIPLTNSPQLREIGAVILKFKAPHAQSIELLWSMLDVAAHHADEEKRRLALNPPAVAPPQHPIACVRQKAGMCTNLASNQNNQSMCDECYEKYLAISKNVKRRTVKQPPQPVNQPPPREQQVFNQPPPQQQLPPSQNFAMQPLQQQQFNQYPQQQQPPYNPPPHIGGVPKEVNCLRCRKEQGFSYYDNMCKICYNQIIVEEYSKKNSLEAANDYESMHALRRSLQQQEVIKKPVPESACSNCEKKFTGYSEFALCGTCEQDMKKKQKDDEHERNRKSFEAQQQPVGFQVGRNAPQEVIKKPVPESACSNCEKKFTGYSEFALCGTCEQDMKKKQKDDEREKNPKSFEAQQQPVSFQAGRNTPYSGAAGGRESHYAGAVGGGGGGPPMDFDRTKVYCSVAGCMDKISPISPKFCPKHDVDQVKKEPCTICEKNLADDNEYGVCIICLKSQSSILEEVKNERKEMRNVNVGRGPANQAPPANNQPPDHIEDYLFSLPPVPNPNNSVQYAMPGNPQAHSFPANNFQAEPPPPRYQQTQQPQQRFQAPSVYEGFNNQNRQVNYGGQEGALNWQREQVGNINVKQTPKCSYCINPVKGGGFGLCEACERVKSGRELNGMNIQQENIYQVPQQPRQAKKCGNVDKANCPNLVHDDTEFMCRECIQEQREGLQKAGSGYQQPQQQQYQNQQQQYPQQNQMPCATPGCPQLADQHSQLCRNCQQQQQQAPYPNFPPIPQQPQPMVGANKEVCKALDCDFFGNPEFGGYCSTCFMEVTKQEAKKKQQAGIRTFSSEPPNANFPEMRGRGPVNTAPLPGENVEPFPNYAPAQPNPPSPQMGYGNPLFPAAAGYPGQSQMGFGMQPLNCRNPECDMFGRPEWNGLCSKCFKANRVERDGSF